MYVPSSAPQLIHTSRQVLEVRVKGQDHRIVRSQIHTGVVVIFMKFLIRVVYFYNNSAQTEAVTQVIKRQGRKKIL